MSTLNSNTKRDESSHNMAHSLNIQVNNHALAVDVSLPLSEGIVGIFGHSGAGKSTLLKTIAGLTTKHKNQQHVQWQNQCISDLTPDKNPCLLQTQHAQLFPNLNVLENLTFVIKHSTWASASPFTLEQVIDWCGIQHLLTQASTSLSGGEQQRVNLARSLLCGKPIILLDEPFSALDWQARLGLLHLLVQLQQGYNLHFVIVSHSLKELAVTCKNLVVMKNAKVIETGLAEPLITRLTTTDDDKSQNVFSTLTVCNPEILTQHNLIKWQLVDQELPNQPSCTIYTKGAVYSKGFIDDKSSKQTYEMKREEKCTQQSIVLDANRISLSKHAQQSTSMLNHLPVTITAINTKHHSVLITLNANGHTLFAEISQLSLEQMALTVGDHLFAQFKAV